MTIEELRERASAIDRKNGQSRVKQEVEHSLQASCVQWFRLQYPQYGMLLFAVPNGTYIKGVKGAIAGQHRKTEGALKGVSDLMMLIPNQQWHGMCIEMKRYYDGNGKSYQSKEQKEFQQAVEAQGYRYVVVRSVEEFMYEIKYYLGE